MPTPALTRRLRYTPLTDLVRGRLTGRLDWRGRIAASELPPALADHVKAVVRRTRLWRAEKFAVAAELIAHFHDGLAAGVSPEQLADDFGDPRTAARLIRRAKRRQRPIVAKVWTVAARGMAIVAALYAVVFARFLLTRPTVTVDYLVQLNASTLATPEADRAWPLYRQALTALGQARGQNDDTLDSYVDPDDRTVPTIGESVPDDPGWPRLTAWLDQHQAGLALLRQAAAKPNLGFVLGADGSQRDPEIGMPDPSPEKATAGSLMSVLLPYLNSTRTFANMLATDARYAATRGNGARVVDDFNAIFGLARQVDQPVVVARLVSFGVASLGLEETQRLLATTPQILTDDQLIGLAHRLSSIGGDTASSLVDLSGERMMFHDIVQRVYSDDGQGDGHLTLRGLNQLPNAQALGYRRGDEHSMDNAVHTAIAGAGSLLGSRRDVLDEYDRLIGRMETAFTRPLRDWPPGESPIAEYDRRFQQIRMSAVLSARYLPITILLPSLERVGWAAERLMGQRDGVVVGVALELYHRRHKRYPQTLDQLVPTMLPRVPADRIDGRPVRYRLIDGRPLVYSVGVDRDDDAGRPPVDKKGEPQIWRAAAWPTGTASNDAQRLASMYANDGPGPVDGDWPLFDARLPRQVPAATRPASRPAGE